MARIWPLLRLRNVGSFHQNGVLPRAHEINR
jgi:hypothetical protein